ncbi:hypothetical protein T069G_06540 [Trichoderma breve]|uniref:DUF7708 domain-containing protein n=1 Tax=Trichoderma breve TaxID=2034170 RepID=A0A9W9E420_9HYPO|nr:hypothetical protein T069G_06540 [Trichoderma breve]KAJ4858273.1 hypothetical protein T069G_06540 [Trichoderma breve]
METSESSALSAWYISSEASQCTAGAERIFEEALAEFSAEFSKDGKQQQWITDSKYGNFESVLASVEEARVYYEERKGNSRLRKGLLHLSEKLYSYSSIMDVLLPQQPEYSTLAYSAMKFLLLSVINHHKLVSQLCVGLNSIAHVISRAQLIIRLYPTRQIRQVIVEIYVNILKFLLRALSWYRESKMTHMLQSITMPTKLRYGDILATISSLSDTMSKMALDSSHAEQRDMHTCIAQMMHEQKLTRESITELITAVSDMKISMVTEQGINASARIEFRQRLSEVQLMQLLSQLSVAVLPDPIKAFQLLLFVSKKRQPKSSIKGEAFWLDSRIQKWNKDKDSSLVIINGTWKTRFHLQSFCVRSIAILFDAKCPVIWALKALNVDKTPADQAQVSTIDLLKYIISQAISVNKSIHTDAALVPHLKSHIDAKSEEDWINILAAVLQGIPRLYIIIDVEVLSQNLRTLTEDFWPASFLKMFSELSARNIGTIVKVALISYGSPLLKGPFRKDCQDLVVSVGGVRQTRASVARARKQGSSIIRTRRNVGLQAMYNR